MLFRFYLRFLNVYYLLLCHQGWRSDVVVRSVILSVSEQIIHERVNEYRPNVIGVNKE